MITKICSKCKEEKSIDEFHNDSNKLDGKRPDCKKCRNTASPDFLKIKQEKKELFEIGKKRCLKCGEIKTLKEFGKDKWTNDKKKVYCKECRSNPGYYEIRQERITLARSGKKKCCVCGKIKLKNEFHKDKYTKYGHRPDCKECRAKV